MTTSLDADGEVFNPLSPEMLSDPYAVYAHLRATDPVHWHEDLGAWVLTRYDDCLEVLRKAEIFAADPRKLGEPIPEVVVSLQTMDPPELSTVRHHFLSGLRRQDLDSWARRVRQRAGELLDAVGNRTFDFVTDIAEPLALDAMCHLYGVPYPDEDELLRSSSRTMVLGMDAGLDPTREAAGLAARDVLNAIISEWVDGQQGSGVLAGIDRVASIPRRYMINSARAFFDAGYSVTANLLGNVAAWLVNARMSGSDRLRRMDGRAVEELVRLVGVVQAVSRYCLADVNLRGRRIARGDVVVVMLGGANHDPEVFPDPQVADLSRDPNPHLGFGRGVHSCLGGHLATRVTLALLAAMADRPGQMGIDGRPRQRPTATQRGFDHLPMRTG